MRIETTMGHDRTLETLLSRLAGILLLVVLGGSSSQTLAQSANCKRAESIVAEARVIYQSNKPSYKLILEKLKIAQDLCPTSGEVWKYAYCSALALGDQSGARRYKQRAVDNDITSLDCEAERAPVVEQRAPLSPNVREKYALIVGIGTFQDESIPRLRFAAKDARDVAAALQDPIHGHFRPENVTLLTDKSATREAILNALQTLFTKAHEDDLVVIYVSSHGSARQQDQGLGGSGYIVTYDSAQKKIWNNAIEYENFAQKTSLIKARRKVTFLDTCYSGQASGGAKSLELEEIGVDDRTAKMFLSNEGSFVITSSNSTEQSWESEAMHNSYFTHYLIEGLNRSKQPPTLKEVFRYLSTKVAEAVSREYNKPQHPQIQPVDGPDDITIGVVPSVFPGGSK
jgi:hypothetical protein